MARLLSRPSKPTSSSNNNSNGSVAFLYLVIITFGVGLFHLWSSSANTNVYLYVQQEFDDATGAVVDNEESSDPSLLTGVDQEFVNRDASMMTADTASSLDDTKQQATSTRQSPVSLSQRIVDRAYQESYKSLVDYCSPEKKLLHCMIQLFQNHEQQIAANNKNANAVNNDPNWPVWYWTMLRDCPKNGLDGPWHNITVESPFVSMCVIEKLGTKHFREVQCQTNGRYPGREKSSAACFMPPEVWKKHEDAGQVAERSVFLRDPLERFLSGFLDKCLSPHRLQEDHCRPVEIFRKDEKEVPAMKNLLQNKRKFFDAYVEGAVGLYWNVHFLPQSIFCNGLYRDLKSYNFVGHMGPNFYQDIARFAQQFGGHNDKFDDALEKVFHYQKKLNASIPRENVGVETGADGKVLEFYSARTVRKVLEYTSIDYKLLGLPIPQWAEDMLQEDERKYDQTEDN